MFEAEAAGLNSIAATASIRVPKPITYGLIDSISFIAMEALSLASPNRSDWESMGHQLARMHHTTGAAFGGPADNFIGSTPQQNTWAEDWPTFFRDYRLRPQFELASKNGFHFKQAHALLDHVENILRDHKTAASLLHGDLWSGNAGFLGDGQPVLFDPASYYGDRETDLAFSEFFGGFPASFYQAYEREWPLESGYPIRKKLYNLYHALNHTNLFGGSYAFQSSNLCDQLLQTN